MENSRIVVDEASLKNNLEFIMKAGIMAAERIATLEKEMQDFENKWLGAKTKTAKLKKSDRDLSELQKKNEELEKDLNVSLLHTDNSVVDGHVVFTESVNLEAGSGEATPEEDVPRAEDAADVVPPS
ncbi:hypothetical protein PIB30_057152 [Stylosanthes scabra]|uniref:Uncharacterized protein n=1 Tax=Stylosanthes scabra TaxID=79078 RepID=A0ABU6WL99_9FABA|nr:hypothetical protein [Stylosanthes scabra]